MRLFIAIDLGAESKRKIACIENEIKSKCIDIKLVEPNNVHITLKFLGEVGEDSLGGIEDKIAHETGNMKQFRLSAEGFGYFGTPNHVKTLWVDVKEGKDELISLIEAFNRNLNHIRRENRKPNPHITIGRVRPGKSREALLNEIMRLKDVKIGEFIVKEIKLKKSTLTSSGPVYEDVKAFPLK